jgi:murein DD-endopeptidase MepM/ murein hydrolase activator NlpD
MDIDKICRRGVARVGLVGIFAGALGACVQQQDPAPVFLRSGESTPFYTPMGAPQPSAALQVVVKRGQTLDGYAYTYHIPKSAIIAANGLHPPYELKAGQHLAIPNPHVAMQPQPMHSIASTPVVMAANWPTPHSVTATPLPAPPPSQQAAIPQPPVTPQTLSPPSASLPQAAKAQPDVIPLDGPAPKAAAAAPPPATLTPPRSEQATLTPPQPAQAAPAAPPAQMSAESAAGGGRFPWPVRGHVLASYGNTPGGGHNDGINIAAPRGTPVHSIDAGTVAYSGNEVKGYGNIVLIKHANGWISAYAHLDDVTVKPGDTIAAGQVIAKVGESGGVTEPQLHFELRRGKKPVDPKEFLSPAPSAEGPAGSKAG